MYILSASLLPTPVFISTISLNVFSFKVFAAAFFPDSFTCFLVLIYSIFCSFCFSFFFFFQLNFYIKNRKKSIALCQWIMLGYSAKTPVFIVKSDVFSITSSWFFSFSFLYVKFIDFFGGKDFVNCHYFNSFFFYLYVHNWTSWRVEPYNCNIILNMKWWLNNSWNRWSSIVMHKMMWMWCENMSRQNTYYYYALHWDVLCESAEI